MKENEPMWAKEFLGEIGRLLNERGEDMPLVFNLPGENHMQLKNVRIIGDEIHVVIR